MAFVAGVAHTAEKAGYWDAQSLVEGTVRATQPANTLGCYKATVIWQRSTPPGTREDVVTIGIAAAKIVGGGQYGVGLLSELAGLETDLAAYVTGLNTYLDGDYTAVEYVWHKHKADNPASAKGYEIVGPAVRRTTTALGGAVSVGRMPDQASTTVTWRTASRKHWGRIYVPGVALTSNDGNYGRIKDATVDGLASVSRTLHNAWDARGYQLGVWTWKHQAFMPLYQLKVDNVWDIQRRRRAKQPSYTRLYTT